MTSRFLICISILFSSIAINAQVSAKFNIDQTEACETLTVNVENISVPNPDTLIWNFGDGTIDTILNPAYEQNFTHTYTNSGNFSLSLTAILGVNSDIKSVPVQVFPIPNADFTYSFYGYPGIKDTFYFSNKRYLFIASNYPNDTTHSWFINGAIQYSNIDSMAYNFTTISPYIIKHKVNINGCVDSTSQTIDIKKKDIKIPNVFSPNNDGVNDLFYIQTDGETNYKLTIHDRNGSRVFVLEGKTISWDGRAYWGEQLNPGNYFYSLKPESGDAQTGIIYLAR